jgi:hypothetical protein
MQPPKSVVVPACPPWCCCSPDLTLVLNPSAGVLPRKCSCSAAALPWRRNLSSRPGGTPTSYLRYGGISLPQTMLVRARGR